MGRTSIVPAFGLTGGNSSTAMHVQVWGDYMSIEQTLARLSDRVKSHSSTMLTEEAVKTTVVPFFQALG
tara:strand:- start:8648 stop:8854 length:207 start_codon:yes stop_codon:yes gene_type:complete